MRARGTARPGTDPRPRPGGAEPRGRRGRGTEGTALGRKPVSGAGTRGSGRHRPALKPGTPGLPLPTGSPVWGAHRMKEGSPHRGHVGNLCRSRCQGAAFLHILMALALSRLHRWGGGPLHLPAAASFVPRLRAYQAHRLVLKVGASPLPRAPTPASFTSGRTVPAPAAPSPSHTPEPPRTPLHRNPLLGRGPPDPASQAWTPEPDQA